MRLQFLYSKNKEREKLLSIYDEYQWFIDNDFPIILPKFFAKIYQNNKIDVICTPNKEINISGWKKAFENSDYNFYERTKI